jgi:hypothetical protein
VGGIGRRLVGQRSSTIRRGAFDVLEAVQARADLKVKAKETLRLAGRAAPDSAGLSGTARILKGPPGCVALSPPHVLITRPNV